jgi:hypothetical protein
MEATRAMVLIVVVKIEWAVGRLSYDTTDSLGVVVCQV